MRPLCPRCDLPLATCLCRWIAPTANRIPLLVLQHPAEQHQAKGSVRLLRLSLATARCMVADGLDDNALAALLQAATPTGCRPVLLFPPTAGGPAPSLPPAQPGPLVVLDGTWRQARQLLRAHPRLQALPRMALADPPPSRYAIRQAERPGQRSSLEAACLALGQLEGRPGHYAPLLAAFDGWVAELAARRVSPA